MELVRVEDDGGVRVLTLDRPPVNALNGALVEAIGRAVDDAAEEREVRALVVYGGRRAFSAGADVKEMSGLPAGERRGWIERGARLMNRIEALDKPIVAAIEGHCLGGGLELAMACHLRVAAEGARLGQPEVKLGIPPGFGGTHRLPRLVPAGIALELLLTGEPIGAERAYALGLVNALAPSGGARASAMNLARLLAAGSGSAQTAVFRAVRGEQAELDVILAAMDEPDAREGMAAFHEKRAARFDG